MQGLLEEGAESLENNDAGPLRDLQLIGAAQRVEHYEMAAYGTARAIAGKLEMSEVVDLLNRTFEEEEAADHKLTEVAEGIYGEAGSQAEESGEEDREDEKVMAGKRTPQKTR